MAKHLTAADIAAIANDLYSWEGPLSWEGLCDKVSSVVGKRPTRQSLSSHLEIRTAFAQAKSQSRTGAVPVPTPSSLKIAGERISRLEAEISALKRENSLLLEQFVRWQYNASNAGIHESQLNKPLPRIDRERSDASAQPRLVKSRR